jgi:retron-type reverse transcriptase
MSFDPTRRRGVGVAGARARQAPADSHRGTCRDFLRRHEREAIAAARGTATAKKAFVAKLLPRAADSRNLRLAWGYLAAEGGQAPGLDGVRFNDLEPHETWGLIRTLGKALKDDTYRPGPDRKVAIPKSGTGTRVLSIPSVIDRLVQRAVVQVVQPFMDPLLGDHCLGYRPGVDINRAVALAERLAVEGDRWAWLAEDVRNAFDCVPQQRLLDVLRTLLVGDEKMTRLLGRLVKLDSGIGVRQGSPMSPLLLNVYLHHFLDKKWGRLFPGVPLLRWADDVLILCRTKQEALRAYEGLERLLLPAGMRLKGNPTQAVHDLQGGESIIWLGHRLCRIKGGLEVSLTTRAWKRLSERLELCHEKDFSSKRAVETILGWVSQMGPCLKTTDVNGAYARVVSLARDLGFEELPSKEEVTRSWHRAYRRWARCRELPGQAQGGRGGGSADRNSETGATCRPAGAL